MIIVCPICGKETDRLTGHVNRARKLGLNVYCGRTCAGIGRRVERSCEEKKELKRLYDIEYRNKNSERLKSIKREYHLRTYDPVQASIKRKERMPYHVEYCRRPEYKAYKKTYDRSYRAKKFFSDFSEAHLALLALYDEISSQATKYERAFQRGSCNKTQRRKRAYGKTNSRIA